MMVELIEVNLLPAEYRLRKRSIRVQREVLYPLLVAFALAVVLWTITVAWNNKIKACEEEITVLTTQINQNAHIEGDIRKLSQDMKIIVDKIMALERINVNRGRWVRLMEVFCQTLPDFTWVTNITETDSSSSRIVVEGRTFSFSEVATFMSRLKENEQISGVDLISIEQSDEKKRIFTFKFMCTANTDVGIEKQAIEPTPVLSKKAP